MRIAFGGLGWKPDTFWNSTMTEFFRAIEGYNDANGGKVKDQPPSDAEVNDLMKKYG